MIRFQRRPQKYNNQPRIVDGIRFDSTAEAEFYKLLKSDSAVDHVDCHVKTTLPEGLTLNVDFLVYYKTGAVEALEVKGIETRDFKLKRKLFDQTHPLAPLKVFKKQGSKWVNL